MEIAARASNTKFLAIELLPTGRAAQRPKQAHTGLSSKGLRIARNIATVKTAKITSAAIDGHGDATPTTNIAPRRISVGLTATATNVGAPNFRAVGSHEGSRNFKAPELRKTIPNINRAANATVLDQLKVP